MTKKYYKNIRMSAAGEIEAYLGDKWKLIYDLPVGITNEILEAITIKPTLLVRDHLGSTFTSNHDGFELVSQLSYIGDSKYNFIVIAPCSRTFVGMWVVANVFEKNDKIPVEFTLIEN